jgi:hypothetical protein
MNISIKLSSIVINKRSWTKYVKVQGQPRVSAAWI